MVTVSHISKDNENGLRKDCRLAIVGFSMMLN